MSASKTLIVLIGLASLGAAHAGELCVSCSEPDATYRCETQGFTAGDARADIACITELARIEGHKRCGVDRRQAAPCDGPVKTVRRELLPAYGPPAPAPDADPSGSQPPDEPSPAKPPAPTVASELKKAGDAAGQSLGDASRAVGSAAEKAWRCMTSFWKDC